jgi:putative acetyltransferase
MNSDMLIRFETPSDSAAIRLLHDAAFGQPAEGLLVDALRENGDIVFSLLAVENGCLAGHVMLSRMRAPFRAVGLGPVAVMPARQRKGLGSRLIKTGLGLAEIDGWDAVFVVGDPAYYGRFGFSPEQASGFQSPYAGPFLMALSLRKGGLPTTSGRIEYAPAFSALG